MTPAPFIHADFKEKKYVHYPCFLWDAQDYCLRGGFWQLVLETWSWGVWPPNLVSSRRGAEQHVERSLKRPSAIAEVSSCTTCAEGAPQLGGFEELGYALVVSGGDVGDGFHLVSLSMV